eukprot:25243-Pelagococcus_subviridis.AAC.1
MRVREHDPLPLQRRRRHVLPRDDLLALTHRDAVEFDLLTLREVLDELRRVRAGGEKEDARRERRALLPRRVHGERDGLHESLADGVRDVFLRGDHRAVLTQRLHEAHPLEERDAVFEIRNLRILRRLLVVPLLPLPVVEDDRLEEVPERLFILRQRDEVEPALVRDPVLRLLLHRLDVERAAALQEHGHERGGELARAHENLIRHHQRE